MASRLNFIVRTSRHSIERAIDKCVCHVALPNNCDCKLAANRDQHNSVPDPAASASTFRFVNSISFRKQPRGFE
jgi:hypothetical protein